MSLIELGQQLLEAAQKGETDHIQFLMCNGAPFTTDWFGTTPLHLAAQNGHVSTAEVLIHAGITIDTKSKLSRTPLHMAAQYGHVETVQLLLKFGANVNIRDMLNMTPLHWAVESGKLEIVELLLKRGAWPTVRSKFDKTPLDIAITNFHTNMVKILKNAEQMQQSHEEELIIDDSQHTLFTPYHQTNSFLHRFQSNPHQQFSILNAGPFFGTNFKGNNNGIINSTANNNLGPRRITYPNMRYHLPSYSFNPIQCNVETKPIIKPIITGADMHGTTTLLKLAGHHQPSNINLSNAANINNNNHHYLINSASTSFRLPINGNYLVALNDKFRYKQFTSSATFNNAVPSLLNAENFLVANKCKNEFQPPIATTNITPAMFTNDTTTTNVIIKSEFIPEDERMEQPTIGSSGHQLPSTKAPDLNLTSTTTSPRSYLQSLSDELDKNSFKLNNNHDSQQQQPIASDNSSKSSYPSAAKRPKINNDTVHASRFEQQSVATHRLDEKTIKKLPSSLSQHPKLSQQLILLVNNNNKLKTTGATTTNILTQSSINPNGSSGSTPTTGVSALSNYSAAVVKRPNLNLEQIHNLLKLNNKPFSTPTNKYATPRSKPNNPSSRSTIVSSLSSSKTPPTSLPCYILTSSGKVLSDKEWLEKSVMNSPNNLENSITSSSSLLNSGEPMNPTLSTMNQYLNLEHSSSIEGLFNQFLSPRTSTLTNEENVISEPMTPSTFVVGDPSESCNNFHLSPLTAKTLNFETKQALSSLNIDPTENRIL